MNKINVVTVLSLLSGMQAFAYTSDQSLKIYENLKVEGLAEPSPQGTSIWVKDTGAFSCTKMVSGPIEAKFGEPTETTPSADCVLKLHFTDNNAHSLFEILTGPDVQTTTQASAGIQTTVHQLDDLLSCTETTQNGLMQYTCLFFPWPTEQSEKVYGALKVNEAPLMSPQGSAAWTKKDDGGLRCTKRITGPVVAHPDDPAPVTSFGCSFQIGPYYDDGFELFRDLVGPGVQVSTVQGANRSSVETHLLSDGLNNLVTCTLTITDHEIFYPCDPRPGHPEDCRGTHSQHRPTPAYACTVNFNN